MRSSKTVYDASMKAAVAAWRRALGGSRVRVESAELTKAAQATYRTHNRVIAIVRPRELDEVRECVRIAAKHHIPVYPISRGKNYGYGSGAPTHDKSVIFDLSLMRRIEVDPDRAAITVEPGVTAVAVAEYLEKHAPGLLASLPVLTSLEASAVGNALEGGVGPGPYADRFAHVYSLEVVLGTGEVIHTGMDRFEGGELLGRTEARLGPSLRDLFMQSNLGVVTRMTIGLFPTPTDLRQLQIQVGDVHELARLLAKLKPLVHAGVITPSFVIFNEFVIIPGLLSWQYPWAPARDRVPLSRQMLDEIHSLSKGFLAPYRVSFDLYSVSKRMGDERERAIRKSLRGFAIRSLPVARPRRHLKPQGGALPLLYWRKRFLAPKDLRDVDPHRDRCGFMWCDFVMPADGSLLEKVYPVLELIMRAYGFEPSIEAHTFWPRTFFLVANIAYDRDVAGEDMRAERCDRAMTAYLNEHRILPGRRRVGSMQMIPDYVDDSRAVMSRLRAAFDPADIIAPGRYERHRTLATEVRSSDRIYDAIEEAHLSLIRKGESKKTKFGKGVHPLRPYFVDRSALAKGRDAVRALLPAWSAAARHLLTRREWVSVLGLDDDFADVLASRLSESPILGTFEGTFDGNGEYKLLQFDASLPQARLKETNNLLARAFGARPAILRTTRAASIGPISNGTSSVLMEDWQALAKAKGRRASEARRLISSYVNNSASQLVYEQLAIFALLTDPGARLELPKATSVAVERHLPWTRVLRPGRTSYRGKTIELARFARDHREELMLRPLDGRGSSSIIGAFVTSKSWRDVLDDALTRGGHVIQERVMVEQQVFPLAVDGRLHFEGCFVGTAFLVVGGRIADAVVTRISERARVGARNSGTFVVSTVQM